MTPGRAAAGFQILQWADNGDAWVLFERAVNLALPTVRLMLSDDASTPGEGRPDERR